MVGIHASELDVLKEKFHYIWNNTKTTYLGIQLTYPSSKLYKENYSKPLEQIGNDIQSINKIKLSW